MILELLAEGCELPITLETASANAELYYHDEFLALAKPVRHFHLCWRCRTSPRTATGRGCAALCTRRRRPTEGDFRGRKAYLCGPPVMIDACISTLMQGRLFENDIYIEKFFFRSRRPAGT